MPAVRRALTAILATTVLGLGVGVGPTSASAAPVRSAPDCTITGTIGDDVLRGTPGDDVICGLGGRDVIHGLGGDDVVRGGSGRDTLIGGGGDDELHGGSGPDVLSGERGDDVLRGDAGADSGSGGRGDDICAADRAVTGCTVDEIAPEIVGIDAPETAAVGVPLTITWTVSDPSGVDAAWARLGGRSGWMTWCFDTVPVIVSSAETSTTFRVTCTPPTTFSNDLLTARIGGVDRLGNWTETSQTEIQLVGGSDDLDLPEFAVVSMPTSLDPSEGDGVSFEIRWSTRDVSGVDYAMAWMYRAAPQFGVVGWGGSTSSRSGEPRLISGDEFDGVWAQEFFLSSQEPDGSYPIYLSLGDRVGNRGMVGLGAITVERCCRIID